MDCKGQILKKSSNFCDGHCDKDEQKECYDFTIKSEKEEEKKKLEKKLEEETPWYRREEKVNKNCATDRGSCE